MIMKTISMMSESQRRAAMAKLAKLVESGCSVTDISMELNIPESEIHECIDWVKNHKKNYGIL